MKLLDSLYEANAATSLSLQRVYINLNALLFHERSLFCYSLFCFFHFSYDSSTPALSVETPSFPVRTSKEWLNEHGLKGIYDFYFCVIDVTDILLIFILLVI